MQHLKPFFEVSKKFFVGRIQRGAGGLYKTFLFKAKSIIFASIFVPCLLQIPLVAFGQDGTYVVNGVLVPLESFGESVKAEGVIADGGYLGSEGRFIIGDGGTEDISFVPPQGKPMGRHHPKQDASDSEQRNITLAHWTTVLLLIFGAWVAISPTLEKRKIK